MNDFPAGHTTRVGKYSAPSRYFSVQIQLLHECNLRCAHCYDANHPSRKMPSTETVKQWVDLIYAFGADEGVIPDIHLSGGEPALRKDLTEIIDYIYSVKGGSALLFTNGTRWSLQRAKDLYATGLRFVQISLEGPERLTDKIRGQGVYSAALQTLRQLIDIGFRVTVSITVTAKNYPVLQSFVRELDTLGIHFHLREVFPVGSATNLHQITRDQRRTLAEWVVSWEGKSTINLEDPIHCSVSPQYARQRKGCVAGRNHFCVDVDGSIYPCRPLAYRVGSIENISEAWQSTAMVRLRNRDLDGQCGRCQLRLNCGGCRVYGLLEGNLFGEDTRCFANEHELIRTSLESIAIRLGTLVGKLIWHGRRAVRNFGMNH